MRASYEHIHHQLRFVVQLWHIHSPANLLRRLLRKLDPQDQVIIPEPIDLLTRLRRIVAIRKTHKRESLSPSRLPILREEHPRHPPISPEQVPQFILLRILTHVRNPKRRQIIPLMLPHHPLAASRRTRSHARGDILARLPRARRPSTLIIQRRSRRPHRIRRRVLPLRRHRPLKRTTCREMLTLTNPALDPRRRERGLLLILQLLHLRVGRALLLRLVRLEARPQRQLDVLAHRGGVRLRAWRVVGRVAELRPLSAFRDARVHSVLEHLFADHPGRFDARAVVAEPVGDMRFGAVGVFGDAVFGEGVGVVDQVIVGPVSAAV